MKKRLIKGYQLKNRSPLNFIVGLGCFLLVFQLKSQVFFTDIATEKNIHHDYGIWVPGGGVSFCDFNNDGWDDLTLGTVEGQAIEFYLNEEGTFRKIPPLVPDLSLQKQILWVDYDNDGDKDLFVATLGDINRLYRNQSNLNFVDVTAAAGLSTEIFNTYGACFGDFDRDGWLDLYLGWRTNGTPSNNTHLLYRNQTDGTFREMAVAAGADDPAKIPFCSAFFDFNNDLWPDLFTANDRYSGNTLLQNNQNGTFTDISASSGAGLAMNAMSTSIGDYNNDGWLDIYITNTEVGNRLLQNNGDNSFSEVSEMAGVVFNSIGWGALFFDADNDGWEDLYVSGMKVGKDINSSAFYYNLKNGNFSQPAAGFAGDTVQSFSNAIGDFNRDGKLDIMVVNSTPFHSQFWENQTQSENNWVGLKLEGVLSNRDGIGSRIEVYTDSLCQTRFTSCGIGFLGQNSNTHIIGLGTAAYADSILIHWPTGHIDRLLQMAPGHHPIIVEGSTTNGQINVDPAIQLVSNNSPFLLKDTSFSIYPNPAKDILHLQIIKNNAASIDEVTLMDNQGQILYFRSAINSSRWEGNISKFSPGLYWIRMKTKEGEIGFKKFVKK